MRGAACGADSAAPVCDRDPGDRRESTTGGRARAKRGFDDNLVVALQGESVLRFLSGGLTIFLAFYVTCLALTWWFYLRKRVISADAANLAAARI